MSSVPGFTRPAVRRSAAITAALAAELISLLAVAPAIARTGVDPGTLSPPPPDFFNAQCYAGAGGAVCSLAFSDDPFAGEPSEIVCGGTELLLSQTRSVVGKRYYDSNGKLVQRHFREQMAGTFSNPVTGRSVDWTQHDTIIHNLSVPGDLSTGTIKQTGLLTKVTSGGRTILTDAGTVLRAAGTDEILHSGGPHPFDDYFANGNASALQPICDAVS